MANLAQDQMDLAVNESHRRELQNYSRSIGVCDGNNKSELRTWLKSIDHAHENTQAGNQLIIEMVGYLVAGGLAQNIRRITANLQGAARTWPAVKQQVINLYLGAEEAEMMQDEVEKIVQQPFEEAREYGNRFQESVDRAYDPTDLQNNALMNARLKKAFISGLYSEQLRAHVYLAVPADLDAAITEATTGAHALGLSAARRSGEQAAVTSGAIAAAEVKRATEATHVMKALQKEVKANTQATANILSILSATSPQVGENSQVQTQCRNTGSASLLETQAMAVVTAGTAREQGVSTVCPCGCPTPAPTTIHQYFGVPIPGGYAAGKASTMQPPKGDYKKSNEEGCWLCGETGHFKRECPNRAAASRKEVQSAIQVLTQAALIASEDTNGGVRKPTCLHRANHQVFSGN